MSDESPIEFREYFQDSFYILSTGNGRIGKIAKSSQKLFRFDPSWSDRTLSAAQLRVIADKLDELNGDPK